MILTFPSAACMCAWTCMACCSLLLSSGVCDNSNTKDMLGQEGGWNDDWCVV